MIYGMVFSSHGDFLFPALLSAEERKFIIENDLVGNERFYQKSREDKKIETLFKR